MSIRVYTINGFSILISRCVRAAEWQKFVGHPGCQSLDFDPTNSSFTLRLRMPDLLPPTAATLPPPALMPENINTTQVLLVHHFCSGVKTNHHIFLILIIFYVHDTIFTPARGQVHAP